MKRIFMAGGAFVALFLSTTSRADAQSGLFPVSKYGCAGCSLGLFKGMLQEGPLFNYGPYAGYYPFEPYGPWNSQLQYTGPYPTYGECGWYHHRHGSSCGNGWSHYARTTWANVCHRLHPFAHHHGSPVHGCSTCGQSSGCSNCTSQAPVSVEKSTAMNETDSNIQPVGHARRER